MNWVNHGSTCPTKGAAMARITRGLMQEGPGVSINRIGGRTSSIGSNIVVTSSSRRSFTEHGQTLAILLFLLPVTHPCQPRESLLRRRPASSFEGLKI